MENMTQYAMKIAQLVGGKVEKTEGEAIFVKTEEATILVNNLYEQGLTPEMVVDLLDRCIEQAEKDCEERKKFLQGLTPETWEEAKTMLCANLANVTQAKDAADGDLYLSAEEYGFDDLIIVPCLNLNGNDVRCVTGKDLVRWQINKETLFGEMMKNIEEPQVFSMGHVMAKLNGDEYDAAYQLADITNPSALITNKSWRGSLGASGVLKAREKLLNLFPDGYTIIPSSKEEMMAFPGYLDEEMLKDQIQATNASCLEENMILGTKPYYFEGRNGGKC